MGEDLACMQRGAVAVEHRQAEGGGGFVLTEAAVSHGSSTSRRLETDICNVCFAKQTFHDDNVSYQVDGLGSMCGFLFTKSRANRKAV